MKLRGGREDPAGRAPKWALFVVDTSPPACWCPGIFLCGFYPIGRRFGPVRVLATILRNSQ